MPYFVDPSGNLVEADPSEQQALEQQGFRQAKRDDLIKHNEGVEYGKKSLLGKAGDIATAIPQGIARGAMAPGMAITKAITGKTPGEFPQEQLPEDQRSALEEGVFSPEAVARKERHPFTAGVGEAVPSMLAGGVAGGAVAGGTLGLLPGAGLLAGESALQGLSQEAVDAVTQKRDFSAKNALMNGGVDLAFSALTFGLAHGLGKLRPGARVAGEAVEGAVEGVPGPRNILSEIDPGEVPEAIGGGRRPARSAGAAGAANRPYKAPVEPDGTPGAYRGAGANDVEPFADDVYEAAAKGFDDGADVKLAEKNARFLADPTTAKNLTDLGAMNVADNLDTVRKVIRDDAGLVAKNEDFARMAADWTPEQQAAKARWIEDGVGGGAAKILTHIDDTRAAAAGVRTGKAGPRVGGAGAIDAGGFDSAIQKTVRSGLDKIRRAEGAEQVVAVDALKREIGGVVRDLGRSRALDEATKAERQGLLTEFYETLQKGLESEDLFGKMGTLQKATNEPVSRLIEPFSRIEAKFSERLGDTWGKTGQQAINRETKAGAVASMLRASPVERREFIRALDDGLAAADDLIAARQAHGITRLDDLEAAKRGLQEIRNEFKFSAVLQAAERRAGEVAPGMGQMAAEAAVDFAASKVPLVGGFAAKQGKGFLKSLANAAEMPAQGTPLGDVLAGRLKAYARNPDLADAGVSRTLPRWLQESLRGHGGQVAGVAGLVGGAAILGAPGTAGAAEMLPEQRQAREALSAHLATLPPDQQQATLHTAEAFARIQQKTEQRVQGAVKDLFALAKDPKAKPRHRSPKARELDQRSVELDVPRHLARFMGKHDDPVDAWREQSELINSVMADPSKLARTMAENLGDLPTQQPEMFASMVGQTMAMVQYLHERMPGVAGRSALDPHGFPPTFEEISEWAGHWVGARYPLDSLDDLASNELVPEQMEAVQSLWPEGYTMFQTTAMAQIHELSQKSGVIPLEALEQIDSALDLDGAGEPILSSAFAGLLKQATAQHAEKMAAEAPKQLPPMQSQSPSRLASSSLASFQAE